MSDQPPLEKPGETETTKRRRSSAKPSPVDLSHKCKICGEHIPSEEWDESETCHACKYDSDPLH